MDIEGRLAKEIPGREIERERERERERETGEIETGVR